MGSDLNTCNIVLRDGKTTYIRNTSTGIAEEFRGSVRTVANQVVHVGLKFSIPPSHTPLTNVPHVEHSWDPVNKMHQENFNFFSPWLNYNSNSPASTQQGRISANVDNGSMIIKCEVAITLINQ